jgi:hypothetical protein
VVNFLPQVVQERLSCSFQDMSPGPDNATTPSVSKRSIASGQPIQSRFPMDPSITSGDLATWSTQQLLHIMHASTDQIEHMIVSIEHAND